MIDPDRPGLRDALERHLAEYVAAADPWEVHHTVQVTSFGGAGTTALCDHLVALGLSLPEGPGHWPYKHQRTPPPADRVPDDYRVVYLMSDPRDAVMSLFARRYQRGHYEAMHGRAPTDGMLRDLSTLETFLNAGVDHFDLAGHLDSWRRHPTGYAVMFVRYDRLGVAWEAIRAFVGLGPDAAPIELRKRSSDWRNLDPPWRERIDAQYGALAARIAECPPYEII